MQSPNNNSIAHNGGTKIWWVQRLTAIIMIPFVIWFVCLSCDLLMHDSQISGHERFLHIMNPLRASALFLFLSVATHHGRIGMKVIIEDYIHCNTMKITSFIIIDVITIMSIIALLFSLLKA